MTSKPHWNERNVPDQAGRVALVTGANSGTGFETDKVLAKHGATVVLGCRNPGKAQDAVRLLRTECPSAEVEVEPLDLGSLASIHSAAKAVKARHPRLDLLINNAGVMIPPYGKTEDGFETQLGTNHLGHFALTGLLLDRLLETPGSRIVTMSSNAHHLGRIRFEDLHFERGYRAWAAYGQSKLANLMFTYELQRRLGKARASTLAVAAHPGWARTELQRYAIQNWMNKVSYPLLGVFFCHSAAQGALPMLRAAVDPAVQGGEYYGPTGFLEFTGPPARVHSNRRSLDEAVQQRLWQVSEGLTGVAYPLP